MKRLQNIFYLLLVAVAAQACSSTGSLQTDAVIPPEHEPINATMLPTLQAPMQNIESGQTIHPETGLIFFYPSSGSLQASFGKDWFTNPFLPPQKAFTGPVNTLFIVAFRPIKTAVFRMIEGKANFSAAYDKAAFFAREELLSYWERWTRKDDQSFARNAEKKTRTIERVTLPKGKEALVESGKTYYLVFIAPTKTPVPQGFSIKFSVDGIVYDFYLDGE